MCTKEVKTYNIHLSRTLIQEVVPKRKKIAHNANPNIIMLSQAELSGDEGEAG